MKTLFAIFLFTLVPIFTKALKTDAVQSPDSSGTVCRGCSFETSYTGDICSNLAGGIRKGTVYLGLANLLLNFDPAKAGMWKGGYFQIHGAASHGRSPSELLTGDFQVASNIDAGDHIYLHELWYRQNLGGFEATAGLLDMNREILMSDRGGYFLNSSFGVPSVVSDNVPVPIYPLTALGVTARFSAGDDLNFLLAVYDGCPTHFEANPYNTDWKLSKDDGSLWMAEVQQSYTISELEGSIKAGVYYHSGLRERDPETGISSEIFKNNQGGYLLAEQDLWKSGGGQRKLGGFGQLAFSSPRANNHYMYAGAGFLMNGIRNNRTDDALGLALAHARFRDGVYPAETSVELFYQSALTPNISLQPDLQYIIHPSGTGEAVPDAFLATLRFTINF